MRGSSSASYGNMLTAYYLRDHRKIRFVGCQTLEILRMSNRYDYGRNSSSVNRKLKELLQRSENRFCADCGAPDPKWASANIGVFICLKCSSIHRSLGAQISKVLSVTLDEWSNEEIDFMVEIGGNSYANAIYEAFLPEGFSKPRPQSSPEERTKFIRSKYELQEFLKPSLRIVSLSSSIGSFRSSDSGKDLDVGFEPEAPTRTESTSEVIGTLKVKVVKGTNLAIRDMLSSDPYVILVLGEQVSIVRNLLRSVFIVNLHLARLPILVSTSIFFGFLQKVQTSVIPSNLNPIWNEEFELSVPENFGPLKLQVFDQDTFSADDIMGEAEVDLQPLITSAMAFGDPDLLGNMQIGKWLKSHDNALLEDSTIHILDGKVRQSVSLKLQNVESGELDIELEWIPTYE
ncbi:hypothetical protein Taro_021584 [Colocasia esculenta]|uniref:Uncharacterized protein n=1 Tax=Colocasia esculenta TaxID=4460 RepID=A0A843UZF4_COLES|nr:hypothetical protein [Colocasia esculenta]